MGPWLILLPILGILIGAAKIGVIPDRPQTESPKPSAIVESIKSPEPSANIAIETPTPSPLITPTSTTNPIPTTTPTPITSVLPNPSIKPLVTPTPSPIPTIKPSPSLIATPKPTPTATPTPAPVVNSGLSNDDTYINSAGNEVHSPAYSNTVPAGATAVCGDGTYSFSQSRRGTCSHHGGVAQWL